MVDRPGAVLSWLYRSIFRAIAFSDDDVAQIRAAAQRGPLVYVLPSVSLPDGHTDEQFVLALLRETGILCVHGSGFGMPAEQGFFRIVFLANPDELALIYADIAAFTASYLARA